MTVVSGTSRAGPFAGTGTLTELPFGFRVQSAQDLKVVRINAGGSLTTLALGTDYAVNGIGNASGGTVVLTKALPAGETVTIIRTLAFTQNTDLFNAGPFLAQTLEDMVDRSVMLAQQLDERVMRSPHVPIGDTATNLTLPSKVERAGKVVAFDNDGNLIATTAVDAADVAISAAQASASEAAASEAAALVSQNAAATSAALGKQRCHVWPQSRRSRCTIGRASHRMRLRPRSQRLTHSPCLPMPTARHRRHRFPRGGCHPGTRAVSARVPDRSPSSGLQIRAWTWPEEPEQPLT